MTFKEITEEHADFVLSKAKDGLNSLVTSISFDKETDEIVTILNKELVEKFLMKFPEASLEDLDNVVKWIVVKAVILEKEKGQVEA